MGGRAWLGGHDHEGGALEHLVEQGTGADAARFSLEAVVLAREPKELFWIEGASQVDLYDLEPYVSQAVAKLSDFFRKHLVAARVEELAAR